MADRCPTGAREHPHGCAACEPLPPSAQSPRRMLRAPARSLIIVPNDWRRERPNWSNGATRQQLTGAGANGGASHPPPPSLSCGRRGALCTAPHCAPASCCLRSAALCHPPGIGHDTLPFLFFSAILVYAIPVVLLRLLLPLFLRDSLPPPLILCCSSLRPFAPSPLCAFSAPAPRSSSFLTVPRRCCSFRRRLSRPSSSPSSLSLALHSHSPNHPPPTSSPCSTPMYAWTFASARMCIHSPTHMGHCSMSAPR